MANYLLLRDNKESGPYSLNDLMSLGLKAYDLVWVQGKSAAWRYPGEVEELKAFAPPVEEQPFDRFFKKPGNEKKEETSLKQKENYAFKRSVFVTMPEKKEEVIQTEIPVLSSPSKTITITENPAAAEVKYPEPVDEIKEMYVKTLQQRKQKIARKNSLFQNLKKASVFFYMIALGILIGFTLKSNFGGKTIAASQEIKQPARSAQLNPDTIKSSLQAEAKENSTDALLPEIKEETKSQIGSVEKPVVQKPVTGKTGLPPAKKETLLSNNTEINGNQNSSGVQVDPLTGERTKKSRNGDEEQKVVAKNDISNLVSVKNNDYKRGAFGGIRDLQLTVTNNSKYVLDDVTVELQYLKPSEQPLKTETIQFRSISPNGSLTIAIPASNRGIKVACKIIKIDSKELDNETAGL